MVVLILIVLILVVLILIVLVLVLVLILILVLILVVVLHDAMHSFFVIWNYKNSMHKIKCSYSLRRNHSESKSRISIRTKRNRTP